MRRRCLPVALQQPNPLDRVVCSSRLLVAAVLCRQLSTVSHLVWQDWACRNMSIDCMPLHLARLHMVRVTLQQGT